MREVTIKKNDALEALRTNREGHRAIFNEAVEGFQQAALELLEQELERIKRGSKATVQIFLPRPEDHTTDYDREIKMLELSVDNEIKLSQSEFAQYVMDDWGWKREFLTSNSQYSGTALRMSEAY